MDTRAFIRKWRPEEKIKSASFHTRFEGFPGGSAGTESAHNMGDLGSIPGLGRSPGEGKGYPLQYSGLENSMDCIVHGVAKSRTQLSDFHFQKVLENCYRTTGYVLSVVKLVARPALLASLALWRYRHLFPLGIALLSVLWSASGGKVGVRESFLSPLFLRVLQLKIWITQHSKVPYLRVACSEHHHAFISDLEIS